MDVDGFGTLLHDYGSDIGATLDDLLPSLCSSTVLPDLSSSYTSSPPLTASRSMHTPARYALNHLCTPLGSGVTADGAAGDGTSTLASCAGVDGDACRTAGGLPEDFTLPMSLLASPMTDASASPFALSRAEDSGILESLLDDVARQPSSYYYSDPATPFEGLSAPPMTLHPPPPRVPARLGNGPPALDEAAAAYRRELDATVSAATAASAAAEAAAALVAASPSPLMPQSAQKSSSAPASALKLPHSSAAAVCLAPPRRTAPAPARKSAKGRSSRPGAGGRRLKSALSSASPPPPSKRRSLTKAFSPTAPGTPSATAPAVTVGPSSRAAVPRKRVLPVKRELFASPPPPPPPPRTRTMGLGAHAIAARAPSTAAGPPCLLPHHPRTAPMDSILGSSLLAALTPLSRDALAPTAADADAMSALIDRCGGVAPSTPAAQSASRAVADKPSTAAAAAAAVPGPEAYLGCGFLPPDSPVSERFDEIDALFAPDLLSAALADAACETDADILEAAIRAASAVCSSELPVGADMCQPTSTAVPPPPPPPAAALFAPATVPALASRAAPAPAAPAVPKSVVAAAVATPSAEQVVATPKAVTAATPTVVATKATTSSKSAPSDVPCTPLAPPTAKSKSVAKVPCSSKGLSISKATATSTTGVAVQGDAAAVAVALGGLSEADFLSAPKLKRKKAKFASPKPSRFCHLCSRTPKTVRQVVCANIHEEAYTCRKVVCEKCFTDNEWDWEAASTGPAAATWVCTHCRDTCPARSQCRTYRRTNERLRVKRLVEKFTTSACGGSPPGGGKGDAPASSTESTIGEQEGGKDAIKPPAVAAASPVAVAVTAAATVQGPTKAPAGAASGAARAKSTASALTSVAVKPPAAVEGRPSVSTAVTAAVPPTWTPASALVSNDA